MKRDTEISLIWLALAFTEGFYIKPRIDLELLRAHHSGLIALSACLAGEIPRRLTRRRVRPRQRRMPCKCRNCSAKSTSIWNCRTTVFREQAAVNAGLLRLHEETNIPLVVTNDAHYLRKEDAYSHDVLLCIQTGKTLDDPNRMKYEPQNFYLRSTEEMAALFPTHPEAIENTGKIAGAAVMWSLHSAVIMLAVISCRRQRLRTHTEYL